MLVVNDGVSGFWHYAPPAGGIVVTTPVVLKAAVTGRSLLLSTLELIQTDGGADMEITILDGASVIWRFYNHAHAANQITPVSIKFDPPLASTIGNALNIQCSVAGTLYANAHGYYGQATNA